MDLRPGIAILAALAGVACGRSQEGEHRHSLEAGASGPREIAVRVPAALRLARELGSLSISFDPAARATVAVPVDAGMHVGVETRSWVFPRTRPRPAEGGRRSVRPGEEIELDAATWSVRADETRYVAEVEVTLFETDVPPSPTWSPQTGSYRVLWSRTLRQAEE
jgi:hypothetical protein